MCVCIHIYTHTRRLMRFWRVYMHIYIHVHCKCLPIAMHASESQDMHVGARATFSHLTCRRTTCTPRCTNIHTRAGVIATYSCRTCPIRKHDILGAIVVLCVSRWVSWCFVSLLDSQSFVITNPSLQCSLSTLQCYQRKLSTCRARHVQCV